MIDGAVQNGDTLAVRFLRENGEDAATVAGWLAGFIERARERLEIAVYDCRLSAEPARILREALRERVAVGVEIGLVYDAGDDKPQSAGELEARGADPAPKATHERVKELGLAPEALRAVRGHGTLMHHKYIVRDREAVWTGSLNWTDDSMTKMENIAVALASPNLAGFFARNFRELWRRGEIEHSGAFRTDPDDLRYAGAAATTDVDFSPGQGEEINEWVAARVLGAKRRIVICSMLINSSALLRALLTQLDRGEVEIWGAYDATQMAGVLHQWRSEERLAWKIEAVERIVREARLSGKRSTPYRPGRSHNFMHNKTIVVDDVTITGSYNLSHAAQANAENMLAIASPALSAEAIAYTRGLMDRFRVDRTGERLESGQT